MKNEITNKYDSKGSIVGAIFTASSLLLTVTYFIPMISILPGALFEEMAKKIVSREPYSNVGKMTILLLSVVLLLIVALSLWHLRNHALKNSLPSKGKIAAIMLISFPIAHSLGFYIYWAVEMNFRGDGQLIFLAIDSFPFSSFFFILFGILIDSVISMQLMKTKKIIEPTHNG